MEITKQPTQLYQCLLGVAVGDSLGLPFEGLSAKHTTKMFTNHHAYNLVPFIHGGMVSDDTEHAVMTVQSYIASQGDSTIFRNKLRMHLRLWLLSLPASIGMATGRALFRLWAFLPNSGVFSAGNGGAMRSAVLGVLINDLAELREFVTISTQITHTDPKAVEGAMVVALSAWFNVHGGCTNHKNWSQKLHNFLQEHIYDNELKGYLKTVFVASQLDKSLTEATLTDTMLTDTMLTDTMQDLFGKQAIKNGITGYMYHTIPAVMFAYFSHPFEPIKGMQMLIKAGGDVDTTCAIAGGIWGVNHGQAMYDSIEGKWLEPMITPDFLKRLSEQAPFIDRLEHNLKYTQPKSVPPKPIKAIKFGGIITLIRNLIFLVIVLLHGFRRLLTPY